MGTFEESFVARSRQKQGLESMSDGVPSHGGTERMSMKWNNSCADGSRTTSACHFSAHTEPPHSDTKEARG